MKKQTVKRLNKHEVVAFRNKKSNIMALAWKDTRVVTMISTCNNATTEVIVRRHKNHQEENVPKPKVITDYTKKIGEEMIAATITVQVTGLQKKV